MKNMLAALLVLALVPATSFAGGGTKGVTSKITVNNHGSDRLAVILDAPKGYDPKRRTVSQFTADGGKIIEVGGSLTVDVKSGQHKFGCAFATPSGVIGKNFTEQETVPANSTLVVDVSGAFNNVPTVTLK